MRRRAVALALAAAAMLAAVGVAPGAARTRQCNGFIAARIGFAVNIERGPVRCLTADRVLRAFLSGKGRPHEPNAAPVIPQSYPYRVDGWSCAPTFRGGSCFRHGTNSFSARDYILAQAQ